MNQLLSSIIETIILVNCVCKCYGLNGVVEVLGCRVMYVNDLLMLLKVNLGLDW